MRFRTIANRPGGFRAHSCGPDEAEDLTQGFFERLLQRNLIHQANRDCGRFRSFQLTLLKWKRQCLTLLLSTHFNFKIGSFLGNSVGCHPGIFSATDTKRVKRGMVGLAGIMLE